MKFTVSSFFRELRGGPASESLSSSDSCCQRSSNIPRTEVFLNSDSVRGSSETVQTRIAERRHLCSPAPKRTGGATMRGRRGIAAASLAAATCFGTGAASARFLQVDPVGYKDQVNLYAYVNNDPVNASDPTGTTCTSSQQGEKTVYACRIDSVAEVNKKGVVTAIRPVLPHEEKKFAAFNARYTAAVNKLMSDPNRATTVAPIKGKLGSFETTAGKAATALISRQFLYATRDISDQAMVTAGGPGLGSVPRTYVHPIGLAEGRVGIVHDGGLHGTPEEFSGGLQTGGQLKKLEHQDQYNDAACRLLGSDC